MTPKQVAKHWPNRQQFELDTDYKAANITNWLAKGYVPKKAQRILAMTTDGKLKVGKPFGGK